MNEIARVEHSSAAYLDMATAAQNLDALKMRHNLMVDAMKEVLRENIDYGKIPGTGDKPTLLKAGAENLSFLFGLRPSFELMDSIEDWDKGLFYYRYRCTLSGGDGRIVANSEGSCNNRETKYRYRNESRKCPKCGNDTIIKGKVEYGGGWLCYAKKGGCGAKFKDGDQSVEGQAIGKVENTEPFELVNTIQKMAQKRALVAAVLIGTGASQFFTQDVEDMSTITIDAEVVEVEQPKKQAPKPALVQPPDDVFESAPVVEMDDKPEPELVKDEPTKKKAHWIDDDKARAGFWAWVGEQGLDSDAVYKVLGVESMHDFTESRGDAQMRIKAWANAHAH